MTECELRNHHEALLRGYDFVPPKRTRKEWTEAGYTVVTKRKGLLFGRTEVKINDHVI